MSTSSSNSAGWRLVVAGVGGVVARHEDRLLVIPDLTQAPPAQADRLIQLCFDDAVSDAPALLRRAAYLLSDETVGPLPGFCLVVAGTGDEVRLLAHGRVRIDVPAEDTTVSAADHLTWVEHRVADPAGLWIRGADAAETGPPVQGTARLDLRAGVVPGCSALLARTEDHAEPPSAPVPAPVDRESPTARRPVVLAPRSFEAVLLTAPSASTREPLPVAGDPHSDPDQVFVQGILCSRGHFGDPDAAYCTVCGISMAQQTHDFVSGPRPPLGVLLLDDGSAFTVDVDYVLGREPELDPAVTAGRARPLTLADPRSALSRVHAEVRLDGWRVLLVDRHSSNGTLVAERGSDEWHELEPGVPVELLPGQRIKLGERVAVYESQLGQR